MILLRPSKKAVSINIAPKEKISIHLGSYIEVDIKNKTIEVKSIYTNISLCVHASGKRIFKLNDKYMDNFLEKLEINGEFEKHKLQIKQ